MGVRETNLVKEVHKQHLRISFTTIARTRTLRWFSILDKDKVGHKVTSAFVQSRVYLAHIVLFGTFAKRHKTEWFRIKVGVRTKDI
jgi:hypothetical protein